MSEERLVAVTVIVRTSDSRIFPENTRVTTIAEVQRLRQAIIDNLPKLDRVVCVQDELACRLMHEAHAEAMRVSGIDPEQWLRRPPSDYRTPGDPFPPMWPGKKR